MTSPSTDMDLSMLVEKPRWRTTADSPSMLGTVVSGKKDIQLERAKEYLVGDIVSFKNANGGRTLHKVTHTKPGYVYTKGTFNRNGDGWIPLSDVFGRVTNVRQTKPKS